MPVASATLVADSVKLIRDDLSTNITDPISAARTGRERFVMTSYPSRPVKYPVITVRAMNVAEVKRLGMSAEQMMVSIPLEIRVWARNEREKDELTEQIYARLRVNQLGAGSTTTNSLFDQKWLSSVNVDEADENGQGGVKSRVMEFEYKFLTAT